MAKSKAQLHEALRAKYLAKIIEAFSDEDTDILRVASGEIALPCVDEENNDEFITITVKVPKGSRDGEPYDGYSLAEDYEMKVAQNAEKKAKAEAEKQAQIAKHKAEREAKAKARAEHEAKKAAK